MRYKLTTINLDYLYKTKEKKKHGGQSAFWRRQQIMGFQKRNKTLDTMHTVSFY